VGKRVIALPRDDRGYTASLILGEPLVDGAAVLRIGYAEFFLATSLVLRRIAVLGIFFGLGRTIQTHTFTCGFLRCDFVTHCLL
jgi:hypothetical protein